MNEGIRTVWTTTPDAEVAAELVREMVGEGIAACGTLFPRGHSIYRWQGEVEESPEVAVLLKTSAARVPELIDRLAAAHPYEVPEIVVQEVLDGFGPYLEWVATETVETD